jgi:hypothetical protein
MTRRRHFLALLLIPAASASMAAPAAAQEGLFVRFTLGSGAAAEASVLHGGMLSLAAKNHAIGYGLSDRFAIQLSEYGGLMRKSVGPYRYINVDVTALGATWFLPGDVNVSLAAGYGQVAFARNWYTAVGENRDGGIALGAAIRKEWPVARHWAWGLGLPVYVVHTFDDGYTFVGLGVAASVSFYLTPR